MCDYRQSREQWEWANLAPYAGHSRDPRLTRRNSQPGTVPDLSPFTRGLENDPDLSADKAGSLSRFKTAFQIDKERITASTAFRRLEYKTQVFVSHEGDHFRTRLTHTLEVDEVARFVAQALRLNEDLVEAIALGHDVGHTPSGHEGEDALSELLNERWPDKSRDDTTEERYAGAFYHNVQGVRVVDTLEKGYEWDLRDRIDAGDIRSPQSPAFGRQRGLDLTWAVREGILKHTSRGLRHAPAHPLMWGSEYLMEDLRYRTPATLEGQVVEFADEIASLMHDLEDGYRSRLFEIDALLSGLLERVTEGNLALLLGVTVEGQVVSEEKRSRFEKLAGLRRRIETFYRHRAGGEDLSVGNVFGLLRSLLLSNIVEATHRRVAESLAGPSPGSKGPGRTEGHAGCEDGKNDERVWIKIRFNDQTKARDEWYARAWNLNPRERKMNATAYHCDASEGVCREAGKYDVAGISWVAKSVEPSESRIVGLRMADGRRRAYPLHNVCITFEDAQIVGYSSHILDLRDWLREDFIPTHLHRSPIVLRMNNKGKRLLSELYKLYFKNPQLMSRSALERFGMWDKATRSEETRRELQHSKAFVLRIAEHLQGMTDRYLREEYDRLFAPDSSLMQRDERSISDPLAADRQTA